MPGNYFQNLLSSLAGGNQNTTPQVTATPQTPGLQQPFQDPLAQGLTRQDKLMEYLTQQYQQQPQGGGFEDIRAEEMRKFQQDILPGIQQRVASSGMGGQHSSANVQMPMQAGMDLSTRLAGLRDQFENRQQQRNLDRLGGLANLFGGQQSYLQGQTRQAQIYGQSQQELSDRAFGTGQPDDRFNELLKFYGLSQPRTQDVLHDPTEGIGQGAARTIPALAKASQDPAVIKMFDDWVNSMKQSQSAAPLSDNARTMSDYYQQRQYNPTQPFAQAPTS